MAEKKEEIQKRKKNIFMEITHNKSRMQIQKINEERHKRGMPELSRTQKSKIIRRNAKQARVRATLIGIGAAIFSLGAFTGGKTTKLLESANKEITIDASENDKSINIKNFDERKELWINDMKVDLNEINANEEKQQKAIEVIERLENEPNSIELSKEYLKQIYINEYNEKYNTNYTKDNVKIYKLYGQANTDVFFKLYKDHAKNGDEIIRKEYGELDESMKDLIVRTSESNNDWTVEARIYETIEEDGETKENEVHREEFTYMDKSYKPVYSSDEEVEKDGNILVENDMAGVFNYFLDYFDKDANAFGEANKLRQGAINKLTIYLNNEAIRRKNEIINPDKLSRDDEELDL